MKNMGQKGDIFESGKDLGKKKTQKEMWEGAQKGKQEKHWRGGGAARQTQLKNAEVPGKKKRQHL